jgi:hypothetical protein
MRQIVKRVKNGQEVKFICSICGEVIHSMFILDGDRVEINWDSIPEKCSCGAKLTNRQPILDVDNLDIVRGNVCGNISENVHGDVRGNICGNTRGTVSRGTNEKSDMYRRYMTDFENAVSIDYFDMRLNGLRSGNFKVPDNIDHLKIECIKRNISYIESYMERSSYLDDECEKNELKERLNMLRQRYSDMSKKSEDGKSLGKKRFLPEDTDGSRSMGQ